MPFIFLAELFLSETYVVLFFVFLKDGGDAYCE